MAGKYTRKPERGFRKLAMAFWDRPRSGEIYGHLTVDVTVGDGTNDACTGASTANLLLSIPTATQSWTPPGGGAGNCPDVDGTYDPGTDDDLGVLSFLVDQTTDTATASWSDLDSDGCSLAGMGPVGPFASTGTCIDFATASLSVASSLTVAATVAPLNDLTVTGLTPNTFAPTGAFKSAVCMPAPDIAIPGTVTRCLP